MKIIEEHISLFIKDLEKIGRHNMVIGGMSALRVHGLSVRETPDLDIVIYSPSDEQIDILKEIVEDETGGSIKDPEDNRRRSYKLTRDGLTIDFLLEFNVPPPDKLLEMSCFLCGFWRVQRIDTIIEAKKRYNREKDIQDFEMLKNNF